MEFQKTFIASFEWLASIDTRNIILKSDSNFLLIRSIERLCIADIIKWQSRSQSFNSFCRVSIEIIMWSFLCITDC